VGLAPVASQGSPYEAILGEAFASLHPQVRRAHLPPLRAEGVIDVEHRPGWLTRPLVRLMTLPAAGLDQPVQLDVVEDGPDLVWTRCIGGALLRTRQRARGGRLVEWAGFGRVSFDLTVENGALLYHHSLVRAAGIPLPHFLSPRINARVSGTPDGWRVVVAVEWRGRTICRYAGAIRAR
jgi:hypothetical protein